ncbi:MAG TPA: YihY/virulence factor BrkB family protein [Usitatibacter sp.]|nr:YihY/virulence factor BrkB family protein [Usitatibacter sp.]
MARFDLAALADLAKRSVRGWIDDAAPSMGAALAFYAVLSLAPLLLVAIGLAGFFVGRDEAQEALVAQLTLLLGDKAAAGIEGMLDAAGSRDEGFMPALIGLATMVVGATTVFAELRADLDRIWRYKPEKVGLAKLFFARFFSFLLVMSIGALLMVSLVASAFLTAVGSWWFGKSEMVMHVTEFLSSFVLVTLLFALIYKLLPSRRIAWGDVWVGAAVTSVLFWVGKLLIALYITHTAVDSSFGAAGALVIVIVWVYYSSQVFFLGAEFTREYALRYGSKQHERQRTLVEMNADYDSLVHRAEDIVRGTDPVLPRDNWIHLPLTPPVSRNRDEAI